MHAILSRPIGCYAYSVICIRITILISRAPPLTIVGRARGSARTAVPCMCALLFTQTVPLSFLVGEADSSPTLPCVNGAPDPL